MPNQDQLGWIAIAAWEMTWKGIAMWKAAGRKQLKWYIAIFVINSFGLLSIFYIYQDKIIPAIPFVSTIKKLVKRG